MIGEPIEVVIRFHANVVFEFERNHRMTISQLTHIFDNLPLVATVWLHIEEGIHKCVAPLPNNEGQAEFWLVWDELTFSYHAQARGQRKTTFKGSQNLPIPELPQIRRNCHLRLVDYTKPVRTAEALEIHKKQVDMLPLPPKADSNTELNIWNKYIEAQQTVINKLQEPFIVTTVFPLRALATERGLISRYQLRLDLAQEENPEHRTIEQEIRKVGIDQSFDASGNIFLTLDELENGLDAVLRRAPFNEIMERDASVVAIVKVRPLSATLLLAKAIDQLRYWLGNQIDVTVERQHALIHSTSDYKRFLNMLERVNLQIVRYRGVFEILNHGENLMENTEFHEKRYITFGTANNKGSMKLEHLFPEPDGNTYYMIREDLFDIHFFKNTLQHIYGKENVITQVDTIVGIDFEQFNFEINEQFWNELRRSFYGLPFEVNYGEIDNTLAFEFKNRTEFWERWTQIRDAHVCSFTISPDHHEFRFKVRTNIVTKKTQKQLLFEKIETLGGAEMVIDLPNSRKSDRKKILFVGKMNARESDTSRLILHLPNYYEEDKRRTQQFINFIESENHPTIRTIRANLTGEAAKVRWLREAMLKLTEPSELRVNGQPINPNLGTFIFDSAKATAIEYKPVERAKAMADLKENELLRLNESQRNAVFSALNAPDMCLLQGPPGTGKTTVIAEIIWQLIRRDQKHRVLLTSETNLAVDNAIERLLNVKHLNPALAQTATLIKPLRFGRLEKFEEEGKRYSVDRIMRWIDEHYQAEHVYENELDTATELDETEDDLLRERPENNVVADWMLKIANRISHQDEQYSSVLRDWTMTLAMPDKAVKTLFKEKYFKHANVIGSTCSSCGSPAFANGYREVFFNEKDPDAVRKVGEVLFLMRDRPNSPKIWQLLAELDIKVENGEDSDFNALKAQIISRYNIHFDSVIMDEASKATPPELVLPLCFAQKAIIIGDHRQLPPMIHEKDFVEALTDVGAGGLAQLLDPHYTGTSQFARLITNPDLHESVRATFNVQYRMHPHINDVIKQFYTEDGGLTCGLDEQKVDDPNLHEPQSRFHGLFHKDFINKDVHVIWVNTTHQEIQDGTSRVNETEVEAVNKVLQYLKKSQGFEEFQRHWNHITDTDKRLQEQEIGIISFYGKQVGRLNKTVRPIARRLGIPVRIRSVDKFQGMERNIIIVSTVRSDKLELPSGQIVGNTDIGFARAPERLNVALSRARRLLIIVGNKDFFYQFKDRNGIRIYKNAIDTIAENGKIIEYKDL